jgi:hypothetical protein
MLLPANRPSAMSEAEGATNPSEDLADLRAAALLPEQLLQGGEVIILLIKPSPWYIVLESLRFLVITAVLLAGALVATGSGWLSEQLSISKLDLVLLAIAIAGARLVWQFLEWLSRVYVLTDQRVIRIMGFFRVQVFETQLKKIQHTVTLFSIRERFFALGTIGFATAGTDTVEATWRMVAKPLEVHRVVVETLNRYR